MKRPARAPARLSESLHKHLNAYAIAATAAGVGMLASTLPTEAKIVYTKAHQRIPLNTLYNVDVNHDGAADLAFFERALSSSSGSRYASLFVVPKKDGAIEGSTVRDQFYYAFALKRGVTVGAPWLSNVDGDWMAFADQRGKQFGDWVNVKDRYIGLKFVISGAYHYGWIRVKVIAPLHSGSIVATLTGYAYETIPGKPIIAGKTKGPDVITVPPGSLGHLAAGASARGQK